MKQAKQLTNRRHRYHMTRYWGPPCPEYEPLCAACAAWKAFADKGGRCDTEAFNDDTDWSQR